MPAWDEWLRSWGEGDHQFRAKAKHRGGIPDAASENVANMWGIVFTSRGIAIGQGLFGGGIAAATNMPNRGMALTFGELWRNIRSVEVADLSKDRANKAALATFGLLGLGARVKLVGARIGLPNFDAWFEADGSEFDWRAGLRPLLDSDAEIAAKIRFGGEPTGSADPELDMFAQIDQLGGLLEKGLITSEEFAQKKSELLDRL